MESSKQILVAGGAGFLGSHLATRLVDRGHRVTVIDDVSTGNVANLLLLKKHDAFTFVHHDITKPLPELPRFDFIYNLACPASPVHYQSDPIKTTLTSVMGALHLLELARNCGARILQASTSEVYGDPLEHPQNESYRGNVNPIGIRACYDEGKRCAESLFFDYHRVYGVPIKVVRIFNTYGPHMVPDDGRAVSNFVVQALQGKPITIYGDGTQTRSFCYVDDLISGIMLMMESHESILGPVNLGNRHEFTLLELAQLVIELTQTSSRIVFKPLPQDDPVRRQPDIGRAKDLLGWEPRVDLQTGLARTIEYFTRVLV